MLQIMLFTSREDGLAGMAIQFIIQAIINFTTGGGPRLYHIDPSFVTTSALLAAPQRCLRLSNCHTAPFCKGLKFIRNGLREGITCMSASLLPRKGFSSQVSMTKRMTKLGKKVIGVCRHVCVCGDFPFPAPKPALELPAKHFGRPGLLCDCGCRSSQRPGQLPAGSLRSWRCCSLLNCDYQPKQPSWIWRVKEAAEYPIPY